MTFQEFIKRKEQLEKDGIFISIPQYYDLIPDDMVLTPEHIAVIMERNVKRVRMWFSEGLKQGPLTSMEPTRHKVMGIHLKEWLFAGDYKKIVTNNQIFFN